MARTEYNKEYWKTYIRPSRKKGSVKRERKPCISCTKEWLKNYVESNKDTIRKRTNNWYNEKRKNDPIFKFKMNFRRRLREVLKIKSNTTCEIIGCSYSEFIQYIESKFENWMSWENHGKYNGTFNSGWDIDHIIPLSSAKTENEVINLNHYTNLQPLCSHKNRTIKRDNNE